LTSLPSAVCVYCGSRPGTQPIWLESARALGKGLAERGIDVVYGGGGMGMMGATADAAIAAGGHVVGIIPRDLQDKEGRKKLPEIHVVGSMHERKMMMAQRSDAFIVLPGGLGTLDETFEILTWRQLRFHDKPIILADIGGYWQPLLDLMNAVTAEGFADPAHISLLTIVQSVDEIFAALEVANISDRHLDSDKI